MHLQLISDRTTALPPRDRLSISMFVSSLRVRSTTCSSRIRVMKIKKRSEKPSTTTKLRQPIQSLLLAEGPLECSSQQILNLDIKTKVSCVPSYGSQPGVEYTIIINVIKSVPIPYDGYCCSDYFNAVFISYIYILLFLCTVCKCVPIYIPTE